MILSKKTIKVLVFRFFYHFVRQLLTGGYYDIYLSLMNLEVGFLCYLLMVVMRFY